MRSEANRHYCALWICVPQDYFLQACCQLQAAAPGLHAILRSASMLLSRRTTMTCRRGMFHAGSRVDVDTLCLVRARRLRGVCSLGGRQVYDLLCCSSLHPVLICSLTAATRFTTSCHSFAKHCLFHSLVSTVSTEIAYFIETT